MGLLKAAAGAAGGVLADQWLEFFSCDALPADVLAVKGQKNASKRSSNTRGSENVITNGSGIIVADGQCMVIVDQGKVVDVCAEPGEYTYDYSTEPSIFVGDLKQSIIESLQTMGKRFSFGGEPPKDQRVYYFNTKELVGNKYGTPQPVPFRVVDERAGIDLDVSITCFGEYSYRICDPVLFYTNVCGNIDRAYTRDELDGQLKTELLTKLQPAFAVLSENGVRYSQLPAHADDLADVLNSLLSEKWSKLRGIEIVSFGVSSVKATDEDEATIKEMQKAATYSNAALRDGLMATATAAAMQDAAKNEGGSMGAFVGMGMASGVGGAYQSGSNAAVPPVGQPVSSGATLQVPEPPAPEGWTCACGTVATGKFCPECGAAKPAAPDSWTCACGTQNAGKFCTECGAAKPVTVSACGKCGWVPEDPANPPKFCPECGNSLRELG